MYAHNLPMHRLRALAAPRFAAGVFVTLALLSAACSNDSASRINAPPLNSASALTSAKTSAITSAPSLGLAANFVVLGGAGVTCTLSTVTGDVGSVLTVTNNPPLCSFAGNIHQGDPAAIAASADYF